MTAQADRPNILLITTDQQRWDTIGALGNSLIRTPALDRLAHEGVAFTSAYTPSPVCVSARCSLLTGLAPHQTRCTDNMPMPQDVPSFLERLADEGFQTHGVGKMHFTPDPGRMWGFESRDISEEISGLDSDFDDYRCFLRDEGYGHVDEPHGVRSEMYYVPQPSQLPAHLHNTAWVADRSRDFLKRRDRSRPFFLWASFIKPHPPFEAPTPWNKLYRCAEMSPPYRPEGFDELLSYWNQVQNRYKYRDGGYDALLLRTMKAAYYACISFIDYHVGRILDGLGDDAANTLVVFTSDHGELLGDYGSYGKRSMLDAAARVPLLVRWPGRVAQNQVSDTPASLLDLWPTFLSAAGIEDGDTEKEGYNLVELARTSPDRTVYSQFQSGALAQYMSTSKRWKYIYSAPDRQEWLFDRNRDTVDRQNLAGNPMYAQTVDRLREQNVRRFREAGYENAVKGDGWREYPIPRFPTDGDEGLLFQDPPGVEERVAALGEYARPVTVRGKNAVRLLVD